MPGLITARVVLSPGCRRGGSGIVAFATDTPVRRGPLRDEMMARLTAIAELRETLTFAQSESPDSRSHDAISTAGRSSREMCAAGSHRNRVARPAQSWVTATRCCTGPAPGCRDAPQRCRLAGRSCFGAAFSCVSAG